jgi:hypothetical protein
MSAARIIDLEAENALLRTAIESLTMANLAFQTQVTDLTHKLEALLFRVAQRSRRMYANTFERHDPNQQSIFGDGTTTASTPAPPNDPPAAAPASADAADTTTANEKTARRGGKKPGEGRLSIPVHLQEVQEIVDLPKAERIGSDGRPLVVVDRDITDKLDYTAWRRWPARPASNCRARPSWIGCATPPTCSRRSPRRSSPKRWRPPSSTSTTRRCASSTPAPGNAAPPASGSTAAPRIL